MHYIPDYNSSDSLFKFIVYDADGITQLYSSEYIKAYHKNDKTLAYEIESESKKRINMFKKLRKKYSDSGELIFHLKTMSSAIKHISRVVTDKTE